MDNGSQHGLTLSRLPQGGFVVSDIYRQHEFCTQHFASTSIDEALQFMRDKIAPLSVKSIS